MLKVLGIPHYHTIHLLVVCKIRGLKQLHLQDFPITPLKSLYVASWGRRGWVVSSISLELDPELGQLKQLALLLLSLIFCPFWTPTKGDFRIIPLRIGYVGLLSHVVFVDILDAWLNSCLIGSHHIKQRLAVSRLPSILWLVQAGDLRSEGTQQFEIATRELMTHIARRATVGIPVIGQQSP